MSASGVFLGTQPVDRYGRYLYPFPAEQPASGPEVARVLRPGGMAFIKFMPIYHADGGHHLVGLLERPWVHLLHDQAQIEEMIRSSGGVTNEVPAILASLNGYRIGQYREMFRNTDLQVLQQVVHEGFCMGGSADADIFKQLRRKHSEKELSTLGMTVVLKKKGRRYQ